MRLALLSMTCSAPAPPPPPAAVTVQPTPAAHAGGEGGEGGASSGAESPGTTRASISDGASGVGGGATFLDLEQGEPSTGAHAPAADRRDGAQGVTAGTPQLEPP